MLNWTRALALLVLACLLVSFQTNAGSQQAPPTDKPKSDKPDKAADGPKAPTHKVEKGPFKVEVTLKGVFEAEHMTEVSLTPEAWSPQSGGMLILKKAVEHGATVRKGDAVLWLDLEKIDQTIRDLENDRQLAELSIKQAEEELPQLEKAAPHDLAAAERARRFADEDLKKWVGHDRALMEKVVNFRVKNIGD